MAYRPYYKNKPQEKQAEKPWYVLECENGYLCNVFELFNNSPKRPRLMVADLQEAIPYPSVEAANEGGKLGRDILGIECKPVPIRFVTRTIKVDGRSVHFTEIVLNLVRESAFNP